MEDADLGGWMQILERRKDLLPIRSARRSALLQACGFANFVLTAWNLLSHGTSKILERVSASVTCESGVSNRVYFDVAIKILSLKCQQ